MHRHSPVQGSNVTPWGFTADVSLMSAARKGEEYFDSDLLGDPSGSGSGYLSQLGTPPKKLQMWQGRRKGEGRVNFPFWVMFRFNKWLQALFSGFKHRSICAFLVC